MENPTDPAAPPGVGNRPRRSESDRYLGGVAGGIAESLAIDPLFVRLALLGASLYFAYATDGGLHTVVLLGYATLWAVLPTTSQPALVFRLREQAARRELLLVAAGLALALLLLDRPGSVVVVALAALAVALLRDPSPSARGPAHDDRGRVDADPPSEPGAARVPRAPLLRRPASRPSRPRREPALWPLTVGLVVLVAMVALAMDQATGGGVDPAVTVDVALLAVGSVLVLSAWRGRARVTVLALVPLLPLWVAFSVTDVGRFDGEGSRSFRPTVLAAPPDGASESQLSYEIGYGTLHVDLRGLPLGPGETVRVGVGVTAGRATVTVPSDAVVDVRGEVGLGRVDVVASRHLRTDSEAAVHRSFDRSYPALGVDCHRVELGDEELRAMAASAGIGTTGSDGTPLSGEEVAAAVDEAGYPRPTVSYVQTDEGAIPFDENGHPLVTTTVSPGPRPMTFWNVAVGMAELELCRPAPPPARPATIIVEPTIGLGTLEIRRA